MNVNLLNSHDLKPAREALARCCGSKLWLEGMLEERPFRDAAHVKDAAKKICARLQEKDWLEAFAHHPRIGDVQEIEKKFAATAAWAKGEQSGAESADRSTLIALKEKNDAYFAKFGFIFIVCASGKSAKEMLALLEARLGNSRTEEIKNAGNEQLKITLLRLEKL